jgi:hypothetical protein
MILAEVCHMSLRFFVLLSLLSGLAAAQQGTWTRFFNHHPMSVKQGTRLALSNAFSSAFNPLGVQAKQEAYLPQLLVVNAQAPSTTLIRSCSIPLANSPVPKQFFLSRQTSASSLDTGMIRAVPAPPCKP